MSKNLGKFVGVCLHCGIPIGTVEKGKQCSKCGATEVVTQKQYDRLNSKPVVRVDRRKT